MAANRRNRHEEPLYIQLRDHNHLRPNENLNRASKERLSALCAAHGLAATGTAESMRRDLQYYLSMDWGSDPEKVTVARLHRVQGPRAQDGAKKRTAEECFDSIFDNAMWEHIVQETNAYSSAKVCMREG